MGRRVGAETAHVWPLLAVAIGAVVTLLMPVGTAMPGDASSAVALAALALAAAAVTVLGGLGSASPTAAIAPTAGVANETVSFLAERVTDTPHHPLRPRAPGLV
jgi:hypothetical protein